MHCSLTTVASLFFSFSFMFNHFFFFKGFMLLVLCLITCDQIMHNSNAIGILLWDAILYTYGVFGIASSTIQSTVNNALS